MSTMDNNPNWPIDATKANTYWLLVSEVQFSNVDGTEQVNLVDYNSLEDGINDRETFKLVTDTRTIKSYKLKTIIWVHYIILITFSK